mgnify:CR=1 FL=1
MRIELSLARILAVGLTTKQYKLKGIADLALYQSKNISIASGAASSQRQGGFFVMLFEIIVYVNWACKMYLCLNQR